jgi:hypothetical protein
MISTIELKKNSFYEASQRVLALLLTKAACKLCFLLVDGLQGRFRVMRCEGKAAKFQSYVEKNVKLRERRSLIVVHTNLHNIVSSLE